MAKNIQNLQAPLLAAVLVSIFFLTAGIVTAQAVKQPAGSPNLHLRRAGFETGSSVYSAYLSAEKAAGPLALRLHNGKYFLVLRFSALPSPAQTAALNHAGIKLLEYIPDNAYHAAVPASLSKAALDAAGITDMLALPAAARLHEDLSAVANSGSSALVKVSLTVPETVTAKEAIGYAQHFGGTLVKNQNPKLTFNIPANRLNAFADGAFWTWTEPAETELVPYNYTSATNTRSNVLNSRYAGSRNLSGAGVMVGIGDGGHVTPHLDYQDRVINTNPSTIPSFADHGDHVTGTVGGGGLVNTDEKGMAFACSLLTAQSSDIIDQAVDFNTRYKMLLTNNSYGVTLVCGSSGNYNSTSVQIDNQLRNNPKMLHCFAASNDGATTCSGYPAGYSTISIGYGAAKNALTVGAVDASDSIAAFSSRGPTRDGRLKPEIADMGVSTNSTIPVNAYGVKSGTSMATPACVGSLTLLTELYRRLNANQDMDAALLKAVICNTAEDRGNAHADFRYGYGRLNVRRAALALEANRYIQSSISNGGNNSHTINVPSGVTELRVLISWTDREASSSATTALVNNLNLSVTNPLAVSYNPWVLTTTPALVANPAVRGIDNLNNTEQVTIDAPAAGTYTLNVNGATVPFGPQTYYITYEYMMPGLTLCHPVGGEAFNGGSTQRILWDGVGVTSGTLGLDYTTNNGSTWTAITSGLAAGTRYFDWTVPTGLAVNAKVRVTHSAGLASAQSTGTFSIMDGISVTTSACDGSIFYTWPAVTGASSYTVYLYRNNILDSLTTITGTSYIANHLTNGTYYIYAFRPKSALVTGRRSNTAAGLPTAGTVCNVTTDAGAGALVSPATLYPRTNTSTALSSTQTIAVKLKNFGTNSLTITNQTVSYRVNHGTVNTLTASAVLAANAYSGTLTFPATADMHAPGDYLLEIWTQTPGDNNPGNDTLRLTVHQIANNPFVLPVTETFEATPPNFATTGAITGISGACAWDYRNSDAANARLRNYVITDLNYGTGLHTFTLDRTASGAAVADSLIYTLNLSAYSGATSLMLDFDYMQHGETSDNAAKRVWARGSDTQPWVQVYNLYTNMGTAGVLKKVRQLDLVPLLGGQTITSSFQIKFGWGGTNYTYSAGIFGGFSFDNITVSAPGTDVALVAVDSPVSSCSPSDVTAVTIRVKNNSTGPVSNVPVSYMLDNGTVVNGTIPFIAPGATVSYSFPGTVNISANAAYRFSAWTHLTGDGYHINDSLIHQAVISYPTKALPYSEDFESGSGGWVSYGVNSTWAYGTPGSKALINFAASGSKCWVTNLNGNYRNNELSYLESPCFDLSGLNTNPNLSFSHWSQTESGFDYNWVEYSTDGGTWTKLGVSGQGTNWYNNATQNAWDGQYNAWNTAIYVLPLTSMADKSKVKVRIVMSADEGTTFDGVGIDDIKLYYDAALGSNSISTASAYCAGGAINAGYTAVGSFFSGNTFTAQLSNGSGSFAAPVAIGSVTAVVSGSIPCTIPANTPAGSGYRIRVVSTMPAITTLGNGADITINTLPAVPTASNNSPVAGATLQLSATSIAGATGYTWTGPGGYAATGQVVTRSNFSAAMAGTYSVKASNGSCVGAAGTTTVIYVSPSVTWTGASSNDWALAANWNPAQLPDAVTDVTVNAGGTIPVISGTASARGISINAGASLSLGASGSLTVAGAFSNAGTFNGSAGTVTMNGSAAQAFSGNFSFGNLTVNNPLGVNAGNGTLSVSGVLKLMAGNFNVSNATVKLLSNTAGTASLAKVEAAASLTGNLNVQRYITGGSAHNINAASPVKGQTLAAFLPYMTVYGQFPGANASRSSSVYYYDPTIANSTNGYYKPGNITDSLQTGKGILLWAAPDLFTHGATFTYTGAPQTGNVNTALKYCGAGCVYTNTNGWNLAGNPYACAIDWHTVTKTNASNQYQVYNKTQYASYSQGSGIGTNGGGRYIPLGQGFFALANGPGASLSYTEDSKITGQSDNFLRTQAPDNVLSLVVSNAAGYTDEAAVRFMTGGSKTYSSELSAYKRPGTIANISVSDAQGQALSIMARPQLTGGDTISLNINAATPGSFTLTVGSAESFTTVPPMQLADSYLHTLQTVTPGLPFAFSITPDSATFRPGRFSLILNPAAVTGITPAQEIRFSIYPNPGTGLFTLSFAGVAPFTGRLQVLNALGQPVFEQAVTTEAGPVKLDMRHLPAGVYQCKLKGQGFLMQHKLVKE